MPASPVSARFKSYFGAPLVFPLRSSVDVDDYVSSNIPSVQDCGLHPKSDLIHVLRDTTLRTPRTTFKIEALEHSCYIYCMELDSKLGRTFPTFFKLLRQTGECICFRSKSVKIFFSTIFLLVLIAGLSYVILRPQIRYESESFGCTSDTGFTFCMGSCVTKFVELRAVGVSKQLSKSCFGI